MVIVNSESLAVPLRVQGVAGPLFRSQSTALVSVDVCNNIPVTAQLLTVLLELNLEITGLNRKGEVRIFGIQLISGLRDRHILLVFTNLLIQLAFGIECSGDRKVNLVQISTFILCNDGSFIEGRIIFAIILLVRTGSDLNFSLADAQRSNCCAHAAVVASILQHIRERVVVRVVSTVVLYAFSRRRDRHRIACRKREHLARFIRLQFGAAVGYFINFVRMFASVVHKAISDRLNLNRCIVRRNLQRAFGLVDCVVFQVRASLRGHRERIGFLVSRILRASAEFVGRAFAVHPAALNCQAVSILVLYVGVRQGCAVILLLGIAAGQRQGLLVDLQCTGHVCDSVVVRRFSNLSIARFDLIRVRDHIALFVQVDVRLLAVQRNARQRVSACQAVHCYLLVEAFSVCRVVLALRQRVVSVVQLILRRDGQCLRVDLQSTGIICDSVVVCRIADLGFARFDLVRIRDHFAFSVQFDVRLLAVQRNARQRVGAFQAAHCYLLVEAFSVCCVVLALRQRVVSVFQLILRRDGQCLRVDLQSTGIICDSVVVCRIADLGLARFDLVRVRDHFAFFVQLDVRLLAVQRDARQRVSACQAYYRYLAVIRVGHIVLALRQRVVSVVQLILRRDG